MRRDGYAIAIPARVGLELRVWLKSSRGFGLPLLRSVPIAQDIDADCTGQEFSGFGCQYGGLKGSPNTFYSLNNSNWEGSAVVRLELVCRLTPAKGVG